MSHQFEIEWPDFNVTVIVELLVGENPKLCEELWQALPFNTIFMHTISSGELFKVPIPLTISNAPAEKLVLLPEEPPGSVTLSANGVHLFVKYGTVVEPFRVPRIAWIPEGELEKFRNLAIEKLRDAYFFTKETNVATMRRKE